MEAEALFSPGNTHIQRLITRLFRLEAVRTVDVNRAQSAMIIGYDSRLLPDGKALGSFSEALQQPDSPSPLDDLIANQPAGIRRVERRRNAGRDDFVVHGGQLASPPPSLAREPGVHHERIQRLVNLALGTACFGMSIVGIMTPFVPTMPFVLATGYFLASSSPTLHELFRRSPLFGEMLYDWEERGGWRPTTKLKLFALMAFLWGVTLAVTGFSWPLVIIMGLMSSISIVTILRVRTVAYDGPAPILRSTPG